MASRNIPKLESDEPTGRLAVLIDADNAQAGVIEGLFAEIARLGHATVRRIYGDFTAPASSSWKKVLQKYAIKPVQQFAYSIGKERYGQHADHRRDGSALHAQVRRFLSGDERQ